MKLTTVLLIATLLQVSATGLAQKITFVQKNATIKEVFDQVYKQTGYSIVWPAQDLQVDKKISANFHNTSLEDVMKQCLNNLELDYAIEDKSIVVKQKEESIFAKLKAFITAINVKGKIIDEHGVPISGVTVKTKDNNKATVTDVNGNFSLQNIDEKSVLVISSIGYLTKELNAKPELGTIVLERSISKLDEIKVIGYGTTTERLSTGSSSHVTSKELDQQPVSNPILGLEGRVPGAFITQTAGYSGAQFNIQIRGQNSISALNINNGAPLYVVDGIPFNSKPVEQTAGASGTIAFSPLNAIDPTEIESIDILKDADATAIYGSRGANGVVLITTKKGKAGNTKVNVDLSSGFGDATHTIPLLSTGQYLSIRRQAFANDGVTPTIANAPDLTLWDQNAYTDYTKLVLGNTQHQTKATFDISGGDQSTQFLLGGNYRHESTTFPSSVADDGVQFHLNMQHHSNDNKFGVSVSVSYDIDNNAIPSTSVTSANYGLPPNYPLYNSNGSLYFGGGFTNPLAVFNSVYSLKSNNMIANATLHYMVIPGLDLKVNGGYNYDNVFSTSISPASATNPALNATPSITLSNNYIKTYIIEPQATYTHTWGKGKLTAIVGGTWQETQYVQPYYVFGTYTNVQLAKSLGALNVFSTVSGYTDYKYDSGFGRLEYAWDAKYLFSGNIRRDGSSRFGDNKPFGNFGSGAFAWIFSKEDFANSLSWLSFGKLKTSYGSVGNDKTLNDYQYLSTYSSPTTGYGTTAGLYPTGIANPYLQWEQTSKLDVALDLGFLQDRIFFSADYYRNRTSHLLGATALPSQTGFGNISAANLPDGAVVQNKGIELELSTVNIKTKDFNWTSSINFTHSENVLLSFPNILTSTYANTYVVGQSLNFRKVYHSTGIINGVATVQDVNNDGKITSGYSATGATDFIIDGNSDPKFYGGLSNTLAYKGFRLDFLFQFIKRTAQRGDLLGYPGTVNNIAQSILDLPFKYSATSGVAFPTNSYSFYTQSDAAIQDASFIRLKNVSLSYNVPSTWTQKLKMSSLQVYVHAQNLLTITAYKGYDPETLSGISVPTLRMMVAGIKTTF